MPIYTPSLKAIPRLIEEFPNEDPNMAGALAMPMNTTDHKSWDIEMIVEKGGDGMTAAHVLGTNPKIVDTKGWVKYRTEPHCFKEKEILDERQILKLADLRDERQRFEIDKWVAKSMMRANRRVDVRVETSRWAAFNDSWAVDEDGIKFTQTFGIPSGNKINVANNWSNPVTGTPISDIITLGIPVFDGYNVTKINAFCNHKTARYLVQSENFLDRLAGLPQTMRLTTKDAPELFTELTALDSLTVGKGYYTASGGTRTPFIPDNKLFLVAEEEGNGPTAEWVSVPSLHRGSAQNPEAGKFALPNFTHMQPEDENPHGYILSGIYGGPVIWKPWLCAIINVNPN